MANRSDRDPPSLNRVRGEKPTEEMRRGSADSIRASGKKAPHQRPDTKLQSACPSYPNRSLRSGRRPYKTLREQWARVAELDKEIGVIERRIKLWHRGNAASQQIAEIPGVGVLSATAVVAAMGDPAAFRSGREFAAWLGLVPRHSGTGGRVRMLGISKRGDRYLRTLLIHGARAVLTRSKAPPEWALRLAERRPANVVTVAIANKTARTIWALLAHDRAYQPNFVNQPA